MSKKNFSVLVVDDEQVVREMVRKILFDEGFKVFVAEDGKSAIEVARNQNFDAALLDIKLPDISGVEVFERIKVFRPNVEAVIMTAYEIKEMVNRAFELGAFACLHKPFDIKKLLQILNDIKRKNEQ
ncbi:MAG: response regulator [Candidatus Omnitrophica bacterium]|nr:response regulator [Candidatus Omnitrophota bacterium]